MTSAALAHVPLSSAPVMFARSSRIIDEYTPPSFSPEVSPTFSFVSLASEERLSNNEESTLQQGETNHLNLSCSCEEMVEFLSGEKFVSSHRAGATTSVAGDWAFGAEGMMVMTNFRLVFIPFSLFSLLLSVSSREQSPCLHENGAQTSSIDSPLPSSPLDNKYDANNNDNTDRSPSSNNDGDHDTSPPPSYAHPCSFRVNLTDIQESVAGAHRPRVTCQFPECRKEAQLASISQENEAKFFTLSLPLASIYHIECRYQYQALNHSPNGDEPAADCGYRGPWPSQFPPEWRRETVGMFEVDCKSFRSVLFICLSDSADALSPNRLPPVFSSSELVENSFQEHSSSMDAESRRRGRSVSVKTTINPKGLPENQKQQEQKREQVQGRGQEQEQEQQQEQEQPLSVSESFAEGMTFDNMCVSPTPSSGFPPQQGEKDPRSLFALGTLYNWCPPSWHLGYLGTSASGTEAAKQVDDDGFPLQLEGDDGNRSYPPSSYSSSSSSSPTISDAMFFDQFLKSLTQNSLFLEGSSHVHPSASSTAGSSSSSSSLGGARKKAAASCPDKLFAFSFTPTNSDGGRDWGWGVFEAEKEFDRLGFSPHFWKVSHLNEKYTVSPTYPQRLIVPKSVSEKELKGAAAFRTQGRLPAVVWRSRETGAVIARSSQPRTGILRSRNHDDEKLLRAVAHAAKSSAPVAKRTREEGGGGGRGGGGGGGEEGEEEAWTICLLQFLIVDQG